MDCYYCSLYRDALKLFPLQLNLRWKTLRQIGLIEAVEMALGENHDASPPFSPGNQNRFMPAFYMLSHHDMQQHASSTLAGRPWVKQHFAYKYYPKAQNGYGSEVLQMITLQCTTKTCCI